MTPERVFGERVKASRTAQNLSQAELAARVSVHLRDNWTQSTVAKTEAATRPIRLDEAHALASVLAMPLHELVGAGRGDKQLEAEARLQQLLLQRATLRAWKAELDLRSRELEDELDHVETARQDLEGEIEEAKQALEKARR